MVRVIYFQNYEENIHSIQGWGIYLLFTENTYRYIWYYYLYNQTPPECYEVNNVLLFFSNWSWTVTASQGDAAPQQDAVEARHPPLQHPFVWRGGRRITPNREWTTNALNEATVYAIRAGSVKRVGVLFTIDAEAFASPSTLLKVNLAICILWAAELVILKPRTDRMKTRRREGGSIPFNDIPGTKRPRTRRTWTINHGYDNKLNLFFLQ